MTLHFRCSCHESHAHDLVCFDFLFVDPHHENEKFHGTHMRVIRPGHPPGRVGFGSGQKKPGVFSSGPCPTRPGGRAVKLSPHPTRQPVGSGRVRVGSGRAYVKCRVPSGFSGFGSKFLARARPVSHTGSKILTRARPSNSSGRVGSGYFRAGWVGSVGSGSPCPGLSCSISTHTPTHPHTSTHAHNTHHASF